MAVGFKEHERLVDKPMTCAWWVWRAEKDYESLIDVIDRVMAGGEEWKGFYGSSFGLLTSSYNNVEKYCDLDLKDSKEKILDAKWQLERGTVRGEGILRQTPEMAAKWDLLSASAYLLDEIKDRVKREGGPISR